MKSKILIFVLFSLYMLPGSLFGQYYVLPENMRSGSSVHNQQVSGYTYITFTLNRLTNLTSFVVNVSGSGGYSDMNLSVSPNTGMLYNQRDLYSGNYTYAAEDLPAGTYMVTISLWGTVSSATPIYVTIVCTGDELPSPPEMDPPAPTPSYYPDAITLGSANRNHIVTRTYTATNGNAWQDAVGYYDGLGRPEQTVRVKAGGGTGQKDWVSLTLYDAHGREEKSYLPAALGSSNNGAYVNPSSLKTQAQTSNGSDSKPYSLNVYEASPLNRVVTQYGPGNAWQSSYHGIETQYLTNTQSAPYNCKRYSAGSADTPTENGTYAPAQLYVNETTDEDGHVSYTFTDKLRQVLLTRQMDGTTAHDTYYVYDDRGNLRFVLPPKYQDAPNTTGLAQYAYQYKYDHRKRMIAKKLPGAEWIYYIYDKDDRLIFTQDGVQRAKSTPEWTFSISDAFGRTVLTGTCTHSLSYTSNPLGNTGVYANYSGTSASTMGYTVSGVTLTNAKVFTANYYDTYSFRSLSGFSNSHLAYNTSAGTDYQTRYGVDSSTYHHKGKLTGTAVALLDDATTPTYLYTAMYYDDRGRVIQTNATNQFSGGYEKEYIAYNFVGQPVKRKHVHYKGSGSTQTEDYAYTYDQAGRLLTTKHKLNGGSEQTLVDNGYDDLGRLTQNSRNGDAELMSNYTYNIRSWLKTITGILFSDTLYYNDTYAGSTARYNGNIGAMSWRAGSSSATLRGYTFSYDNLSRLTAAAYKEGEAASSKYGTSYAYDKNGNMTSLQRYGHTNTSSYDLIDDLTITYTGNQLKKVEDAAAVPSISLGYEADFRDRSNTNTTTEYTFDANGNLKTDLNKGISSNITYNSLNLPRTLKFGNTSNPPTNTYTYTADGRLVTVVRESATTQYAGNMIYEGTTLKRILVDGGYIEGSTYYYYLTDHLGNNRVVANASGTVQQINHYYPYGMTFDDSTEPTKQPYKYGGKEFDKERSLNWSDFEARQYMNDVPMFTTMDPLAEKYYSYSPYAYCAGNPVRFIDPDGKKIVIGSWWGRFMAFLGVNNYEAKVQQQIEQLKKDDTVVKGMIERLENSPHIVTINPIPPNRNPDLNLGDGNVTLPRKKDRTRPQGSSIEYNPDNNKTNNGNNRPAKVGLTHEFGHADDLAHGRGINVKGEDGKIDSQKVLEAEKYPIEMENRIRKVLKIEERKAEEYETR